MNSVINTKELRAHLQDVVRRVRRGGRFTVLYRSRPAFDIVPVNDMPNKQVDIEADSLYRAGPVGASAGGDAARRHDKVLYG